MQETIGSLSELKALTGKAPKYKNQITFVEGVRFQSLKEAERYKWLRIFERQKKILDLKRQVAYPIFINGILICKWLADFTFYEDGKLVIEDAKGFRTKEYKLKKKMVEAFYTVTIKEV